MKKELIERINNAIEREIMRTGAMGTENVNVKVYMTDEELDIFRDMDEFDVENYWWEIEGNELNLTYTEEV